MGLVGAVGTDLDAVYKAIEKSLDRFRYTTKESRLIELIHAIEPWENLPHSPEEDRINRHMDAGNHFRETTEMGDALVRLGIGDIRRLRRSRRAAPYEDRPVHRRAYVFRSLKHPEEVAKLRKVYGSAFFLVGAYCRREMRLEALAKKIAESHNSIDLQAYLGLAHSLNGRDEREVGKRFGQNVHETFPMADIFVDSSQQDTLVIEIDRFIDLLFGHPYHTPSRDEYGMFHAGGCALRSASLSRQVGTAICNPDGEIVALGTNEVPKFGGGQYWAGDPNDGRDWKRGSDTSDEMKRLSLKEILEILSRNGWLDGARKEMDPEQRFREAAPLMAETRLMKAIEYGRSVHAEMAGLLNALRHGISVKGCILYTTTFPCHDCARHIVGSGISRVVYVEPYAKSLAPEFHDDSLAVDDPKARNKVLFQPFVGVAPRTYMHLFDASEIQRKNLQGKVLTWSPQQQWPRLKELRAIYIDNEKDAIAVLDKRMEEKGLRIVS